MSQLGWVQILYDQQLTSIGCFLSAKIAIETQQFFCPPKPRVVGSIPASRAKSFVFCQFLLVLVKVVLEFEIPRRGARVAKGGRL